jgi:hypothetical protein
MKGKNGIKIFAAVLCALAFAPRPVQASAAASDGDFVPASASVSYANFGGGPRIIFDDARTVNELYAAFANVRRTGAEPVGGHTDDYFEFSFTSEDGTRSVGAVYQSGKLMGGQGELHEVTGYDDLSEAASLALWRKGFALFADESPIEALLSLSGRRTPDDAAWAASALTELEGAWVWRESGGDGSSAVFTYTFNGDGTADIDELLSSGKRNKGTVAYGLAEKNLMAVKLPGAGSKGEPLPFDMSGGQLRLTFDEGTLVFERKGNAD